MEGFSLNYSGNLRSGNEMIGRNQTEQVPTPHIVPKPYERHWKPIPVIIPGHDHYTAPCFYRQHGLCPPHVLYPYSHLYPDFKPVYFFPQPRICSLMDTKDLIYPILIILGDGKTMTINHKILKENKERGLPGILGSLDCMHWAWKGCHVYWFGQYKGHITKPTIILEAAASYDYWIWHAFFGLPDTQNDINVLHKSPLFEDLKYGISPSVRFMINGHQYIHGCYLADGIYPKWSTLVQCYRQPPAGAFGLSFRHFNDAKMALRKNTERVFVIWKRKFIIICGPYRGLSHREMHKTMLTYIILHKMIIQETRHYSDWTKYEDEDLRPEIRPHRGAPARDYVQMTNYIQKRELYEQLRDDLRLNL